MDGAIVGELIASGNSPNALTRAGRKALISQGVIASSGLTLPGDAKEAQKKQPKLSHGG